MLVCLLIRKYRGVHNFRPCFSVMSPFFRGLSVTALDYWKHNKAQPPLKSDPSSVSKNQRAPFSVKMPSGRLCAVLPAPCWQPCELTLLAAADRWLHDWRPLEPGSDPSIDVSPGRLLIRVGERPEVYNRQTGEYRVSVAGREQDPRVHEAEDGSSRHADVFVTGQSLDTRQALGLGKWVFDI